MFHIESVLHRNQEWMVIRVQDVQFQLDGIDDIPFDHLVFSQLFHCVMGSVLLILHEEYGRVATFTDHTHQFEIVEDYLLGLNVFKVVILNHFYNIFLFNFVLLFNQLHFDIKWILRQAVPLFLRILLRAVRIRIIRIAVNIVCLVLDWNVLPIMQLECLLPYLVAVKERDHVYRNVYL